MNLNFDKPYRNSEDVFNVGSNIFQEEVSKKLSPEIYENFKDIYDFFDKLYDLFDSLNELNELDKSTGKITLLDEYPDEEYVDNNVAVVYKLGEKKYFTHRSEGSPKDYTQVRPFELESKYDLKTNNVKSQYANKFVTAISLEVVAGSNRDLLRVVKFIEAVLFKHKSQLKCFVADFIYVGQTPTEFSQAYQNKRLFSRSLIYQVVTYETYELVSEEIKYIK